MVRWLVVGSIKVRLIVLTVAAAIVVLGSLQLSKASVDVLPEFMPPYVEIQTEALGLSSAEVEQLITVPLEADLLNGTEGVSVIRSESVTGLSSIVMVFEAGTDPYLARARVQERLTQAHALPQVSKPPTMLQPLSSSSRFLMISLESDKLTPIERSVIARWTIRPKLMGIPGVANVAIWGQRERQIQVQVDPQRLREKNVTLQQVVNSAGNAQIVSPLSFLEASTPGTGGFVETAQQRLQVRHVFDSLASPEELAKVPIDGTDGRLRLADVATIVEDHQPLIGDAVINGRGQGVLLVVEKFPGTSAVDVTKSVEDALDNLRPGLSDLRMDTSLFRPAGYIATALNNLALVGLVGGVLFLLVLLGWFLRWRTAVVALVAASLSLIAAALVLDLSGATFNAMGLAGLAAAVALVVDDAVSGADAASNWASSRRRAQHAPPADMSLVDALVRARNPLGHALVIGLLLVVPILSLEGRPGDFFRPTAVAYALAALASFVVAVTVVPALSSLLFARGSGRHETAALRRLTPTYDRGLMWMVRRRRLAMAVVGIAAVISVAGTGIAAAVTQPSVVPTFQDRDVLVRLDGPPGTSLQAMTDVVSRASQELGAVAGVERVGAQVGRAVTGDQVVDVSSSQLSVRISADADYARTTADINRVAAGITGFTHDVVTYSGQRIRDAGALSQGIEVPGSNLDVLTGTAHPIVVRVYGENPEVMRAKADEIRSKMLSLGSIVNPQVRESPVQEEIQIRVDLDKARQSGLKPGDVRRAEAILLQGIQVGSIFEGQKVFDVVVQGVPSIRQSVENVRNLTIDTPSGGSVRLADVATVGLAKVPSTIERDAVARRLDITADVQGASVPEAAEEVRDAIEDIAFPLEHHAEVLTSSAADEVNVTRTIAIFVGVWVAVFLILQAASRSWRLGVLAFLTLPAAVSGGVAVALLNGLSFGTLLGLLAVLGLAVRNVLLFVGEARELESTPSVDGEVARHAAANRVTAVLGSALAVIAVALPGVVLGQRPGLEFLGPMAAVLIGGVVTSTLLALFVLPALYPSAVQSEAQPSLPPAVSGVAR